MFKGSILFILMFTTLCLQPVFSSCDPLATPNLTATAFLKNCSKSVGGMRDKAVITDVIGQDGVLELSIAVAQKLILFGAFFAIGAIVYSGIRYTTSIGDDERIKGAKNTAIYAIIGLILLLTAFPFVDLILKFIYSITTT